MDFGWGWRIQKTARDPIRDHVPWAMSAHPWYAWFLCGLPLMLGPKSLVRDLFQCPIQNVSDRNFDQLRFLSGRKKEKTSKQPAFQIPKCRPLETEHLFYLSGIVATGLRDICFL